MVSALRGVSARNQPETYDEFVEYWDDMLDRMAPNRVVRYGAGYIRKGVPRPGPIPAWLWWPIATPINAFTRTVLAGTPPAQVKTAVGIEWSASRERRFLRAARVIRALGPIFDRLPIGLAYLPWAAKEIKRSGRDPRRARATGGAA